MVYYCMKRANRREYNAPSEIVVIQTRYNPSSKVFQVLGSSETNRQLLKERLQQQGVTMTRLVFRLFFYLIFNA